MKAKNPEEALGLFREFYDWTLETPQLQGNKAKALAQCLSNVGYMMMQDKFFKKNRKKAGFWNEVVAKVKENPEIVVGEMTEEQFEQFASEPTFEDDLFSKFKR